MAHPVVVGIDGSEQALAAADYAAELAQRRHAPLRLIYVLENMFYGYGPMFGAGTYAIADEQLRSAAGDVLTDSTQKITSTHPGLEIDSRIREGGAAAVLIDESQDAEVTVVGSRGAGGFAGLLLGSVSTQVASHGHGAVVVVRPAPVRNGPILVAFDGSPPARAALDYAVGEALALGVTLVVATAYWPEPWGFGPEPEVDREVTAAHEAEVLVDEAIGPYQSEHSELRVEVRTIRSLNPEQTLTEESAHAGLTVVGSRGRGGFTGLLLGSVSRTLVHHAAGPVAVIHAGEH